MQLFNAGINERLKKKNLCLSLLIFFPGIFVFVVCLFVCLAFLLLLLLLLVVVVVVPGGGGDVVAVGLLLLLLLLLLFWGVDTC